MKKLLILSFVLLSTFCYSQAEETGKAFITTLFGKKDMAQSITYLDATISSELTKENLGEIIQQIEGQLGKFKSIISVKKEGSVFYYYSDFEKAKIDIQLSFTEANKINGFYFVPHEEK